jgi:hypothetical protein
MAARASNQARAKTFLMIVLSFLYFARLAFWLGPEFAGRWLRVIGIEDDSEAGS